MFNRLIKSKYFKLAICLSLIVCLFIGFSVPAHATWNATSKNRFGAWLGSALLALNITLSSTVAPLEQMYEYVAEPIWNQIEYTYPATNWEDDIMDRSVIKIVPDSVTIDGQQYTDIWLSHDAAEKFRVNAFDFQTAYALASNTNGTFAQGVGTINGVPAYLVNNVTRTQGTNIPYANGDYYLESPLGFRVTSNAQVPSGKYFSATADNFTNRTSLGFQSQSHWPMTDCYFYPGGVSFAYADNPSQHYNYSVSQAVLTRDPFDFDYVTGTIPADQVLPADTGMNIRVPSNTPGLQVFIQNNIDYTEDNGKTIDFNLDPDIELEIDDLIDIIAPILVDLDFGDVTFTEIPDTPTPAPVLPDTVFPDTQVDDALQPIINTINNNTQNIIETIPAPSEITNPIIQEIQNTGDEIIENIPKIDEICNNIDAAPINDLDLGTTRLPTFLLPYITDLRGALGIWHYVTDWVSSINSTFSFILGVLAGTSILTPIYASIAGYMCIRAYRRMCS